ncbi:MAG: hypothetical protein KBC57_13125 [Neisseriaceae bacterium]|nr:hypothetical protein [Neisseriaceae bacterium]MBP6863282.1 hypothetical protein [Neisseriaceae bacterium]
MARRVPAQGFVLGWSLLLSLLLGSWVWLSGHGSGLAARSSVSQAERQRVAALAQLTLAQALTQWPQRQNSAWQQVAGQWPRYQALFSPRCVGGLCDGRYVVAAADETWLLSGAADDPALRYQGRIGQRVLRVPRYAWVLLGQLPDGRLAYRVTVRAWGVDSRTVVTLTEAVLWRPPEGAEPPRPSPKNQRHALGE